MYTIELDNNEGRGQLYLGEDNRIWVKRLADNKRWSTDVMSTPKTFDRDTKAMYGGKCWNLLCLA